MGYNKVIVKTMPQREKQLILITDDDKDFREAVSMQLQAAGFDTIQAKDSKDSVQKAKELQPNLILMDINMPPGPSGIDTALELKEAPETKEIKIVFLSGLENPWPLFSGEKGEVSKEMGMEDYFVKTKDFEELVAKIKKVLNIT